MHRAPARGGAGKIDGKVRAELVATRREMEKRDGRPIGGCPSHRIAARPARAPEPAPRNGNVEPETTRDQRQCRGVTERVGGVEDGRRLGAECSQGSTTGEQVSHERFAARNQLVGKDVPGPGFDRAVLQRRREIARALGTNLEVVVEHHRLSVQQKRRPRGVAVEELIDQGDEPLSEPSGREVPLAIPVRVREDVDDFVVRCVPRGIKGRIRHARAFCLAREAAASGANGSARRSPAKRGVLSRRPAYAGG